MYYNMIKIGMICWKQGGGTTDYVLPKPFKAWKQGLEIVKKGEHKGKIPLEKAIIVSFGFIDICPKKIGFKNETRKTILETFLLKIIFDIFATPSTAQKEKSRLIK